LLDLGADVAAINGNGSTALHLSIQPGGETVVKMLLSAGADAGARSANQSTPLLMAALRGEEKISTLLLDAGGDVSARDVNQISPLLLSVQRGDEKLARLFLRAGADVAVARAVDTRTALHVAAGAGHAGLVRILLDAGADVVARDGDQKMPRDLATLHPEVVAMLRAEELLRRSMAFAMGHQERLGAASWVLRLDPELVRMVLDLV